MHPHPIVQHQTRWSRRFDRLLPAEYQLDGNRDFLDDFAPAHLHRPKAIVYDIGGGKNPLVSQAVKQQYRLRVVGLDIDQGELDQAPEGLYDEVICADITEHRGRGDGDVVICQALLEHVPDTSAALRAIASMLRPGGLALLFVPSRNAVFARLNLLLPQRLKTRILYTIFPQTRAAQGFASYYDRCTPAAMKRMATEHGLTAVDERLYFCSTYFTFFVPLHIAWRVWLLGFRRAAGEEAAESFALALRKE